MPDRLVALLLVCLLAIGLSPAPLRAHDVPDRISVHAFLRPGGERLHLLVRVPLALMLELNLPKRGPGYLALDRLEPGLEQAAAAAARALPVFEDGRRLDPVRAAARVSRLSDRSFEAYDAALASIEGPPLPATTDVFWNQGYLDAHLEYPIRSAEAGFAVQLDPAPALADRMTLDVRVLAPDGRERAYVLTPAMGRVAIDPSWLTASRLFVESGVRHILEGMDHLLFLLCLMLPFRRVGRALVAVVTSFTVAHSLTLIASAYGAVPSGAWFPPLVETLIAASILYMAIENLAAPNLPRRWVVTGLFGLAHGFGFSFALREELQFAGDHLLVSLLAFNVGVEVGQLLVLAVGLAGLTLLARAGPGARLGPIVLSVLAGHTAWHWMTDRAAQLSGMPWPGLDAPAVAVLAAVAAAVVAGSGVAWSVIRWRARRTQSAAAGRAHG